MRQEKPSAHPISVRRHRAARAIDGDTATSDLVPAMVDALSDILRDETRVNLVAPSPGSGSAADVARTVVFLASPAASVVTGANIVPGVKH